MLIGFKVGNFLSFNEETVFSMVATKGSRHNDHVMYKDNDKFPRLVKGSFLYGANASGKSNFVEAISFAQNFIANQPEKGKTIDRKHYLLSKECEEKPSIFEFEFITKGKIYNYRFEITNERVVLEILKDKTTAEKILYRRDEAGIHLSIEDTAIMANAATVRENNLILSEFINRDIEVYSNVFYYITCNLIVSKGIYKNLIRYINEDEDRINEIIKLMNIFDFDIQGLKTSSETMTEIKDIPQLYSLMSNDLFKDILEFMNPHFAIECVNDDEFKMIEIKTEHTKSDNSKCFFNFMDESDGTKRILDFIPMLYDMAKNEKIFVIDEIGRSLHPHLLYRFIETYYEFTKGKNCQLIATTHQDNLIDLDLLRQDEIWFVEKDNFGQSSIYPLSKYKLRNDKDVRTSYNSGRLGAIPSLDYYFEVEDDDE